MLGELASADAITWLSTSVKALVYVATLLSAGSAMAVLFLRNLPEAERSRLRKIAVVMAIAAAVLSLFRLPIRASFLMGGTWAGAVEPMMLRMVFESPLGSAVSLRLIGLALVCTILMRGRIGQFGAAIGVVLVAASFAMRGHALEEPRWVLGLLVSLHILGLAFWIGIFVPLDRLTVRSEPRIAGALAEEFGRKALWIVAGLAAAGMAALVLLTLGGQGPLTSPYTRFFAVKLALFTGVMSLAAWNKLRLTPALLFEAPEAGAQMRQSLRLEALLLAVILIVTATLTTVSSP